MQSFFEVILSEKNTIILIKGIWDYQIPEAILRHFEQTIQNHDNITLDFSQTQGIDFNAIAFFLTHSQIKDFQNINTTIKSHIDAFKKFYQNTDQPPRNSRNPVLLITNRVKVFINDMIEFFNFTGLLLYYIYLTILQPSRFRWKSFLYHIGESGFKALPIALLTSFIVGGAISLQGAIQLASMGAPLLSVDTTAKLALREMGPFILALVIAGRSSSSYTAQIGAMNITDEINAMKVMNFSLIEFLVLPRFFALIIIMPFMVFLADAASIFAGMLAIKAQLGISFLQYLERFYETVGWTHFFLGICKAPFFGATIALVGCFRGLQVYGDTEQIGKATTVSVVNTLFWCIFINAVFSVIFTRLDL